MAKEHLNYDQLSLTHAMIPRLTQHRETRGLLGHVIENSPTRVIAHYSGKGHIKMYFENDGLVVMSSTASDPRTVENADKQIRRSLASHGLEYPTMSQVKNKKKKQKDTPEGPSAE